MRKTIENFFTRNFGEAPKAIAVAVSGGVDSMALLFLLDEFCKKRGVELHAITIDHKMRESSVYEALGVAKICAKHKISHKILALDAKKVPSKNIEAVLREARYELLYDYCVSQKITHLFLGHHQNDAAENFLIRLFRGSQIDGLAKMEEVSQHKKIKLCRPFLSTPKSELQKYLKAKKIKHFEDESNCDEKFLRNKIRKFLASLDESELVQERIVKFSEILQDEKQFLDEILLENAKKCLRFDEKGEFLLNLDEYKKIPPKIALKILSLVLIEIGGNAYKPRLEGLKNFEQEILKLQKGKKKNFYGCMAKIVNEKEWIAALLARDGNIPSVLSLRALRSNPHPQKILKIYREKNSSQKPSQKFDEKTQIIDGRFLQKIMPKSLTNSIFARFYKKYFYENIKSLL